MKEEVLGKIRDEISSFCFENCEFMKNSDTYLVCKLSKPNQVSPECKVWEFLKFLYSKYRRLS